MGSAIRLTSRNAYDMMKMTRATGSRNEAPPMIVDFKNSFKGSFHLNNVIDAKMRPSRRLLQPHGRRFIRRLKASFHSGRGVGIGCRRRAMAVGTAQTAVPAPHFGAD